MFLVNSWLLYFVVKYCLNSRTGTHAGLTCGLHMHFFSNLYIDGSIIISVSSSELVSLSWVSRYDSISQFNSLKSIGSVSKWLDSNLFFGFYTIETVCNLFFFAGLVFCISLSDQPPVALGWLQQRPHINFEKKPIFILFC